MSSLDLSVAPLRRGDIGAVAALLARAFHDDPAYLLVCPDVQSRPKRLNHLFRGVLSMRLGQCEQWVAHHGGVIVATATWTPSDLRFDWADFVRHGLIWLPFTWGLAAVKRMAEADGEVLTHKRAHQPAHPHRYLAQLAVDPVLQGRGVGSEILAQTLGHQPADQDCYLITTLARNVSFYQRQAFAVTHQATILDRFEMWAMTRPKQAV